MRLMELFRHVFHRHHQPTIIDTVDDHATEVRRSLADAKARLDVIGRLMDSMKEEKKNQGNGRDHTV